MMINIFERNRSLASKAFDNPYPFEEIKNLENFWPWTMSIAGLIKWLSWETDNILGISKTKLIKQAIEFWFEWKKDWKTLEELYGKIVEQFYINDQKKSGLIEAIEAQRKLRYFSEDYLNKEFDTFMSLLPSEVINNILNTISWTKIKLENSERNYFGNSDDFTFSTKTASIMQIDGLLYNKKLKTVVGVELKIDAEFVKSKDSKHIEQVVKYCNLFDTLLQNEQMLAENFKILVIARKKYDTNDLIKESRSLLKNPEYIKKLNRLWKWKADRIEKILNKIKIDSIIWQDFAEILEKNKEIYWDNSIFGETYHKLIDGFLTSLSKKVSKKSWDFIYKARKK